jgi:excisionase family DNA binding protein
VAQDPNNRQGADELCTVDFAAERLKLHPKTVLRFIHEGRLKANRIGKAYRILRADIEALAGLPPPAERPAEEAWITCIVDIPGVGPALAQKWARTLPAVLQGRRDAGPPLRADVIYEPERSHLKIVVVGPPDDTVELMTVIRAWLGQLTP